MEILECCESDSPYARPCSDDVPEKRYYPERGKTFWNGRAYCNAHWEEIEFMLS
jgi:hypothetical protein